MAIQDRRRYRRDARKVQHSQRRLIPRKFQDPNIQRFPKRLNVDTAADLQQGVYYSILF